MKNNVKINTESSELLQLLSEQSVLDDYGESVASISKDQVVTWAKFVLTDDKPNANRERIPLDEFKNLISTGMFKPVKMALGEIKDGHEEALPIGVITHLMQEGNKIVALAALWESERSEDVQLIKDRVNSGQAVNVSWEVYYGDKKESNGVSDLLGTVLRGVTIVGMPAYAGRTPVLAVAAKRWSPAYVSQLPNEHFLYVDNSGNRMFAFRDDSGKIDPKRFPELLEEISKSSLPENLKKNFRHQIRKLNSAIASDNYLIELLGDVIDITEEELDTQELENKVSDLETKLAEANDLASAKQAELDGIKEEIKLAQEKVTTLESELEGLRAFKAEAEATAQKDARLSAIKTKFSDSGVNKPEEYFVENGEKLLAMEDTQLDFMLQELVAFAEASNSGTGFASTRGVPNLGGETTVSVNPSELAKALRERNRK